jgi:hypothetical protein
MGSTHRESAPVADISSDISFMVVRDGATYAPLLVRRKCFMQKVGNEAARKTYQTAYAPKDFPFSTYVGSGDAL